MIYGNTVGGSGGGTANAYILVDDSGKEYAAVLMDEETALDATENDIRAGKYAATDNGVVQGTKEIPSYNTSEGYKLIPKGSKVRITGVTDCEYTKLQALVCAFNSSISKSVATEKVCIDGGVYPVNSAEQIATVTVEAENFAISLGITNDGDTPVLIRYFMYKEIY